MRRSWMAIRASGFVKSKERFEARLEKSTGTDRIVDSERSGQCAASAKAEEYFETGLRGACARATNRVIGHEEATTFVDSGKSFEARQGKTIAAQRIESSVATRWNLEENPSLSQNSNPPPPKIFSIDTPEEHPKNTLDPYRERASSEKFGGEARRSFRAFVASRGGHERASERASERAGGREREKARETDGETAAGGPSSFDKLEEKPGTSSWGFEGGSQGALSGGKGLGEEARVILEVVCRQGRGGYAADDVLEGHGGSSGGGHVRV
ncbi:hypothetical protein KM043_009170 [Ampulex compressa]|nr:hypothetical protein KM043_009170 [Ampulex compressa]